MSSGGREGMSPPAGSPGMTAPSPLCRPRPRPPGAALPRPQTAPVPSPAAPEAAPPPAPAPAHSSALRHSDSGNRDSPAACNNSSGTGQEDGGIAVLSPILAAPHCSRPGHGGLT